MDSGNFLFAQQFAPFRNQLDLGKGVYLNVGSGRPITPYIIEFELDFENRAQFSIIDKDEKIIFDRDGFPSGANFYIDPRDGKAYFRGSVYATDGVFNGTVYAKAGEFDGIIKARDIRLPNGDTMTSIINDKGKIDADWLDLYGINVKNKAGNTVMTIDENGLRFGTGYSPIQYQFSTSFSGPWHNSMGTNDKYRRDSLDGGITWGSPYQFRGTDGQNGSDANVTRSNIVRAMLNAEQNDGLYVYEVNGKQCLGINATAIKTGTLEGIDIYGGIYHDLSGTSSLSLAYNSASNGQIFSDLVFSNKNYDVLKISDDKTDTTLSLYGVPIITASRVTGKASLSDKVEVVATFALFQLKIVFYS